MPDQHPEEMTILEFGVKALGPPETPTTNILAPIIIPIHPYECQTMSHTTMEKNVFTPSGNYSIPTAVVTTGEFPPLKPLSLVRATMVSTTSTSHSGPILSMVVATTPFTPSVIGPLFSYRIPRSGTSPVLSYSTS
jgi:hypothetical protein